jgi:hypothetical protein
MKKITFSAMVLAFCCSLASSAFAQAAPEAETTCFESRKGASEVVKRDLQPGWPNVKCSPKTGAVLWWGDPYDGTVPMGKMPLLEKIPPGQAVVKPRSEKLALLPHVRHGLPQRRGVPSSAHPRACPRARSRCRSRPWKPWCPDLQEPPARPRPHLVPGLPPHHPAQQAGRPLRRSRQLRPAAVAVRQVPRRQAARLARRHPRQAHRRMGQHRQEALVHLHRMPQPAQRAGRRAQPGLHPDCSPRHRRNCPKA